MYSLRHFLINEYQIYINGAMLDLYKKEKMRKKKSNQATNKGQQNTTTTFY